MNINNKLIIKDFAKLVFKYKNTNSNNYYRLIIEDLLNFIYYLTTII